MDIMLARGPALTLIPATADDEIVIQRLPLATHYGCTLKQLRNGRFHRKVFALLRLMYDSMPRAVARYRGQRIEQSFDRFRAEQLILAGHYEVDVTCESELRMTPVSLSYAKCSERRVCEIYSDLIDRALSVLTQYESYDDLDRVVEQLLDFGHGL